MSAALRLSAKVHAFLQLEGPLQSITQSINQPNRTHSSALHAADASVATGMRNEAAHKEQPLHKLAASTESALPRPAALRCLASCNLHHM